jgi:hypothetical protein
VDNQFRKAQFEGLVEEFGMVRFPLGHGTVEGIENAADLRQGRFGKAAAVLAVQVLDLDATGMHMGNTATGIEPEFLPSGWLARRLD